MDEEQWTHVLSYVCLLYWAVRCEYAVDSLCWSAWNDVGSSEGPDKAWGHLMQPKWPFGHSHRQHNRCCVGNTSPEFYCASHIYSSYQQSCATIQPHKEFSERRKFTSTTGSSSRANYSKQNGKPLPGKKNRTRDLNVDDVAPWPTDPIGWMSANPYRSWWRGHI